MYTHVRTSSHASINQYVDIYSDWVFLHKIDTSIQMYTIIIINDS